MKFKIPCGGFKLDEDSFSLGKDGVTLSLKAGGGVQVQSDLSQNDPTADDYIKNRTHWKEPKTGVIIPETSIEISNVSQPAKDPFILEIQEGSTYEVTWDGNVYQCVAYILEGIGFPAIGNATIASLTGGNDEPFFIVNAQGQTLVFAEEAGTHTVSISGEFVVWHTLDKRYLPANIATTDDVQEVAGDVAAVAHNVGNKMNSTNPTGIGSFSMHRKASTTIGAGSHAEGYNGTASGDYSHAEGSGTTASGQGSHAEGYNTTADGHSSHAEGSSTIANGEGSHAEGYNTTAGGYYSHAEGKQTTASGNSQHVQGRCNIIDIGDKYAHIVGNGTSINARSNAHTLDWHGNAWFAGTVEGTAVILPSSAEGSTKKFKITVDDNGTLSATLLT